jgi:hypothetical protein
MTSDQQHEALLDSLDALEDAECRLAGRGLTLAQARHIHAPAAPSACEARWAYLGAGLALGALGCWLVVSAAGVAP